MNITTSAFKKARNIKLLIMDVDGVLTDGKIYITANGDEYKGFYAKDGVAIQLLLQSGVEAAAISGRKSLAVETRLKALGIKYIYQGHNDKIKAFNELKNIFKLKDEQIAHIGDDLPDLPIILKAGFGIAVADAVALVKKHADWTTTLPGGRGAVREACELIMQAQGKLDLMQQQFLIHE